MKLSLLAIAVAGAAAGLATVPSSRAQSLTPADLRGIYVDSNALPISAQDSSVLVSSLTVPGVDGIVLVLGWRNIEPRMGKFTWTSLDQWMALAVAAHKKVELSIRADYHTPSWLFQPAPAGAGATPLGFSITRKPTDPTCLADTLAAPWDTAFLAQWDRMLDSVSTHLKSTGAYDDVVLLRLTGINKDSDELHLPAQSSGSSCVTDAVAIWQAAGYRPSLLLKGWDGTTGSFKKSFPDKFFSVAIIASTNPFPPIAEDGSVIKGTIPNQSLPLLDLASKKFPGHLVIQNNSLYPGVPAEAETIMSAESLKTMIAFQTNEDIKGQGAACGGKGDTTQCTDSTYLAELQTGIYPLGMSDSLRAQYIEVFALNVNASPGVILNAHNELVPAATDAVGPMPSFTPIRFDLALNYPNPFNPTTTIRYAVPFRMHVTLVVFNALGQEVATLVNGDEEAGYHTVQFGAAGLASGAYFYRLHAGDFVQTKKLLLLR